MRTCLVPPKKNRSVTETVPHLQELIAREEAALHLLGDRQDPAALRERAVRSACVRAYYQTVSELHDV
jgi:hypothetical protein